MSRIGPNCEFEECPTTPAAVNYPTCGKQVKEVPGDYPSIQGAISASDFGDTIRVASGNYNEEVVMKSGICLEGAGIDETTVMSSSSGIIISNAKYTIVRGLTIKNSSGDTGGGIHISNSENILIEFCRLTQNTARRGGGMSISGSSNISIDRCLIDNNFADHPAGGVTVTGSKSVVFTNVTIAQNRSEGNSGIIAADSLIEVRNSIIWGNTGIFNDTNLLSYATSVINYSNIGGWYSGQNIGGPYKKTGNIYVDPQFISASDFHLNLDSPAINAGNPDPQYNDPDGSRNDMGAFPLAFKVTSNFRSPYQVSWTESFERAELNLIGASINIPASEEYKNLASSTITLHLRITNHARNAVFLVPMYTGMLLDELGNFSNPVNSFPLAQVGNGISPYEVKEENVVFAIPDNRRSFVFTTGGKSNIFFSIELVGNEIRMEKIPMSEIDG